MTINISNESTPQKKVDFVAHSSFTQPQEGHIFTTSFDKNN